MFAAADAYDRHIGRYSGALAQRLIEAAGVKAGHRVLDVGCGTGKLTGELVALLGAANVSAVDPSQPFVSAVRAAFPGVTVEEAAGEQLPFGDDTFDAIVSAYAIDHLGRAGARTALAEADRVLKPRGDFLLMLVANDGWAKLAFGPLLSHGGTYGADWWRDAATKAGFEVREEGTRPVTTYFLLVKP